MHRAPQQQSDDVKDVLDAIRRLVRALRIASRGAEKEVGLSAAQLFVLQRLATGPAPSLNELAARTLTHQSSASVVVTKLVARGLVERVRSNRDARRLELSLTPAARRLLRRAPHAAQEKLIEGLGKMSKPHVKQLAHLLSAFTEAAGLLEEPVEMLFDDEGTAKTRS
jgi:DNA-binding MarR family transcriptional regulator